MDLPTDDTPMTVTRAEVFALLADAERRATLAERERCAKVAERWQVGDWGRVDTSFGPTYASLGHGVSVNIAAAIREGEPA